MGIIKLLPDDLINKIAAGEVIESPASVVKELIENSIDANASKIHIETCGSGMILIRVIDDGIGMGPEDALMAIERHATSKISSIDELNSIGTLGFRGEALSSIASVAKLTLRTKTPDALAGSQVIAEDKKVTASECACPRGTDITVERLFDHVPARKKHLGEKAAEARRILEIISAHALANPSIHFKLINDDIVLLECPPVATLLERATTIYGKAVGSQLISIKNDNGRIKVQGLISIPEYSRKDKRMQTFLINKRPVTTRTIQEAVYNGYSAWLGIGRHPFVVLDIELPPESLDVNVHPSKLEVRMLLTSAIEEAVTSAVKEALSSRTIRTAQTVSDKPVSLKDFVFVADKHEPLRTEEPIDRIRIIGQIKNTYVIIENHEGLVILDQHAAQERVLYERFAAQFDSGSIMKQELVEPIIAELAPQDSVILEANLDKVRRFGIDLEAFGKNAYLIRRIPSSFPRQAASGIFSDVIDSLTAKDSKELQEKLIKKACKAAIKANTPLEIAQIRQLIADLYKCKQPQTCPHGRPTMLLYSLHDLERMFKRTGF